MPHVRRALLLIFVAVLCSQPIQAEESPSIPKRFDFKFKRAPLWIAATEAVAPDGSLKAGVLDSLDLKEIARRRGIETERRNRAGVTAEQANPCDAMFAGMLVSGSEHGQVETLAELREVAAERSVFTGRVTGSAVGFHHGMPHTILQIEPDEAAAEQRLIYLLYPAGRIRFDGMTICNSDGAYSATPAIGDAITFVAGRPIDYTGSLYIAAGSWIVYDHEGVTTYPPDFKVDAAMAQAMSARTIAKFLSGGRLPVEKRQ